MIAEDTDRPSLQLIFRTTRVNKEVLTIQISVTLKWTPW
jgi:hypothetical protein